MISVLIATEQHARMFRPVVRARPGLRVYMPDAGVRATGIRHALGGLEFKIHQPEDLFKDLLQDPGVYLSGLALGTVTHPYQKNWSGRATVLSTPLDKFKSRIALFNEVPYFNDSRYRAQGHLLLARTEPEKALLNTQIHNGAAISLVGDVSLDITPVKQRPPNGCLGIFTSFDASRRLMADATWKEMFPAIRAYCTQHSIRRVVLKPHPGEVVHHYKQELKEMCSSLKAEFVHVNRLGPLENTLKNISCAFVQDSFSSHNQLMLRGVESYYYSTRAEKNFEGDLLSLLHAPNRRYTPDNCSHDEWLRWLRTSFCLDGQSGARLVQALKEEEKKL